MAEDIVACSGCGKKFRIPDGSPPSGKFACTACGADVAWGGAGGGGSGGAAKAARGGRSSKAARGARKGAQAEAAAASSGGSRGARRAKGRRARETDDGGEEGGGRRSAVPKEKENKTLPLVIAIMGAVLLVGALIVAFTGEKPDYDKQAAQLPSTSSSNGGQIGGISSSSSAPEKPPESSGTPGDATSGAAETPEAPLFPATPEAGGEDSGIGGATKTTERDKDYRYWFLRDKDELFTEIEPLEGTSAEEAARLRELAATATDFDAGASGMKAEGELADAGRKAMPFLINQLAKAWKGSKWTEPAEQFACFKVQQLAREIVKATKLPSDLFVRFPPGPGAGPDQYERAARMWTAWWRGEGQYIEEFKSFEDEE